MTEVAVKQADKTEFSQPIREITVLWITAGLGCDGESVALTAATQPSIEEIVLGGLPGLPKTHFHNPFYSYENADEFMRLLELAEAGKLDPFILIIEGSIPNEQIKDEGYWATLGVDRRQASRSRPASGLIAWRRKL